MHPSDRDAIQLQGSAAGHAAAILIRRRRSDPDHAAHDLAEQVAHKLELRARILRDMAPAVGVAGPGLPILHQRNCEWAADELDAAAACIRELSKE